ncbi:hypothetical protein ACS0TY_006369 [Phlomoides rotata]
MFDVDSDDEFESTLKPRNPSEWLEDEGDESCGTQFVLLSNEENQEEVYVERWQNNLKIRGENRFGITQEKNGPILDVAHEQMEINRAQRNLLEKPNIEDMQSSPILSDHVAQFILRIELIPRKTTKPPQNAALMRGKSKRVLRNNWGNTKPARSSNMEKKKRERAQFGQFTEKDADLGEAERSDLHKRKEVAQAWNIGKLISLESKDTDEQINIRLNKKEELDEMFCRTIWGNGKMGWAFKAAEGRAGGILSIWNNEKFMASSSWHMEWALVVNGV